MGRVTGHIGSIEPVMVVAKVSKIDAAKRQLQCAIRLLFENHDPLPTHSLVSAAFRLLYDKCQHGNVGNTFAWIQAHITEVGWREFNRYANFLKHAETDPDSEIEDVTNALNESRIGFAILLYESLGNLPTPEMKAFKTWMALLQPDDFMLAYDEDERIETAYREAIGYLKTGGRASQLELAALLVRFYTEGLLPLEHGLKRRPHERR